MKTLFPVLGASIALLLAGCASNSPQPTVQERLMDMGLELVGSNSRIPRPRVNGWSSVDDRHLVVTAGVNDKYLVELSTPCLGLEGAFNVGFRTPDFGLDRFDDIIVRGIDSRPERCPIRNITRLYPIDG